MRTISLKVYLIFLIILIASICLLCVSGFVLYQANSQSKAQTANALISVEKQLKVQLIRISTNFDLPENFPNLGLWQEAEQRSGLCVRFTRPKERLVRSVCRGGIVKEDWPNWFESIYRWFFDPGLAMVKKIEHAGEIHGTVTLLPSAMVELDHAWRDVEKLMSLSAVTVISLCILLYFAVGRAWRPAKVIVAGLDQMAEDNFSSRLPDFNITEWQRTGEAINYLASDLQNTISERKGLALKLVNAQEEERRYLARELHDEFGQSLAGLTAVASLITQTAEKESPSLVAQGEQIGRITQNMMDLLRGMLVRLRPADFDEIGLVESLKGMIATWNAQSGGKTQYELKIEGDFSDLTGPIPVNLYRIVQECLTNISKHANATKAIVDLQRIATSNSNVAEKVHLKIKDNGIAKNVTLNNKKGNGLSGIHERVTALGGDVLLQTEKAGGLTVQIQIPINKIKAGES